MFPDISEHQGAVDWDALGAAYQAGQIEAVSMRAGFGTVRTDLQFARNQQQCRAHGIPAIYYWFNYPTFNTPQAEAAMFNSVVGPLQPGEAMMADFEDDRPASVFPRGQAGVDWAKAFLTALEAPTNATWFYTYTSLFEEVGMAPLLATWPFVWADYSARTDNPFGAIARQFTDCGSTPGVAGCCDQNNVLKPPLSQWLTGGLNVAQLDDILASINYVHNWIDQNGDPLLRDIQKATEQGSGATGNEIAQILAVVQAIHANLPASGALTPQQSQQLADAAAAAARIEAALKGA